MIAVFFFLNVFSLVINLSLTKFAKDHTREYHSALGLFCTDYKELSPYCQDLGPIFFQYGPCALVNKINMYMCPIEANKVKLDRVTTT